MALENQEWPTGRGLIESDQWKITKGFELLECAIKRNLQPHDPDTCDLVPPPDKQSQLSQLQTVREKIKNLERRHSYLTASTEKKKALIKAIPKESMISLASYERSLEDFYVHRHTRDEHASLKETQKHLEEKLSKSDDSWKNYHSKTKKEKLKAIEILLECIYSEEELKQLGLWLDDKDKLERVKETSNGKKLRPSQKHRLECRRIATELWRKDQGITIADMIMRNEIFKACEGKIYIEGTLRNWVKDLCPNRLPGRRVKK